MDPVNLDGITGDKTVIAGQITQPFSELSRKSGALGHVNLIAERDGVIRKIPLVINYQGRDFISFALQVARKYMGVRLKDVKPDPAGLQLKHLQIPTDQYYRMFIDYSGGGTNIQKYSFADVLDGKAPAESFRNKIVMVGITAKGIVPSYRTAVDTETSAIEISANAVDNLVTRNHLSRPFWVFALEVLALVYFGFFLLFVIPKVKPNVGALIMGIFLMTWIAGSVFLFLANGIWLRMMAPILLVIGGVGLTTRKRLSIENIDENIELNKSLGLALQGQGMLDMAYEKFLKCPIEEKSVKDLLYNLGLDFERKRMFNKALAVYNRILKSGAFKDIKKRIKRLQNIENTIVLSSGAAQNTSPLLIEKGTIQPTLGRYEILEELGKGAMGTVYLGRDPTIQREVAIKTLSYAEVEPDELKEVKSRFFREAEAAGKLSHPDIVTIFDVGEEHDIAYMAMELLKGKDLTRYCQKGRLLSVKRILPIISAVAQALDYAHTQGVIHRDIKPANIILLETDQVKVADFGIARVMSAAKTKSGVIFGTPYYMSPEQIAGQKVDGRSDLFSLGVVFYELLTGIKPFNGDNINALMYAVSNSDYTPLKKIAPKTPRCCAKIVDTLLAKSASKRYKSAAQLVKQIRLCQEQVN
jgi:serine/threonine-protein kinase